MQLRLLDILVSIEINRGGRGRIISVVIKSYPYCNDRLEVLD